MEDLVTVKSAINCWKEGGVQTLKVYLNSHETKEDTWVNKIKKLINEGCINSVNKEIELILFNLKLNDNE